MGEVQTEVVERDVEIIPAIELNQSKLDALIQFSQQTEKLDKALERIQRFVLKRALPGDWVQHGDKVNLTGPAAERIMSSLGLMGVPVEFSSWGHSKDTGADKNGEWFTWVYWADVQIGGLKLGKIEGRASSRDQFFGYAHGAWKDLADVKEADIRMAARRCVFKEGIKVALGLRGIPAEAAAGLGLDVSKIKKVTFGTTGADAGAAPAAAGKAVKLKPVTERHITKKDGSKSTVYVIEDENGAKYETFSDTVAKAAKAINAEGKHAVLDYEPSANPKFAPKLKAVTDVGVEPSEGESEG